MSSYLLNREKHTTYDTYLLTPVNPSPSRYIKRVMDHLVSKEKWCSVHYCGSSREHGHPGEKHTFQRHQFPSTSLCTFFSILRRIRKIKQKNMSLYNIET